MVGKLDELRLGLEIYEVGPGCMLICFVGFRLD